MIIVAGSLTVEPGRREAYLETCVATVEAARAAPGCLDFALSADLLDPGRINVYERWESEPQLHRFRGSGPGEGQLAELLSIEVGEYRVEEPATPPV